MCFYTVILEDRFNNIIYEISSVGCKLLFDKRRNGATGMVRGKFHNVRSHHLLWRLEGEFKQVPTTKKNFNIPAIPYMVLCN